MLLILIKIVYCRIPREVFSYLKIVFLFRVMTWLNSWQIKNNFTNPMQIESLLRAFNE